MAAKKGKALLVFDFDGVLGDTFGIQYEWMRHIGTLTGAPRIPKSPEELRAVYTEPFWPELYSSVLGFSPDELERHKGTIFSEYFAFRAGQEIVPVNGIGAAFERLATCGNFDFAIASASGRKSIERFLEIEAGNGKKFSDYVPIENVFGYEDLPEEGRHEFVKPNPWIIDKAVESIGPEKYSLVVYVGDGPSDILAARASRHSVTTVSFADPKAGYYLKERLAEKNPDYICTSPRDLEACLFGFA